MNQPSAEIGFIRQNTGKSPQEFLGPDAGLQAAAGNAEVSLSWNASATAGAKYALTEVTLGIPPAQITPVVIKRIGASEARRLLLTAQRFDGIEAHRLGFAHFLVEDAAALDAKAVEIVEDARRGAPGAIALTKQIISASETLHGDDIVQFAAERFADAMLGEEGREGMAAFAEKRKPAWAQGDKA